MHELTRAQAQIRRQDTDGSHASGTTVHSFFLSKATAHNELNFFSASRVSLGDSSFVFVEDLIPHPP